MSIILPAPLTPLLGWPLLLLPAEIVWIELLIHPTSNLAFSFEPPPPDLMTQPPRPATSGFFGPGQIRSRSRSPGSARPSARARSPSTASSSPSLSPPSSESPNGCSDSVGDLQDSLHPAVEEAVGKKALQVNHGASQPVDSKPEPQPPVVPSYKADPDRPPCNHFPTSNPLTAKVLGGGLAGRRSDPSVSSRMLGGILI